MMLNSLANIRETLRRVSLLQNFGPKKLNWKQPQTHFMHSAWNGANKKNSCFFLPSYLTVKFFHSQNWTEDFFHWFYISQFDQVLLLKLEDFCFVFCFFLQWAFDRCLMPFFLFNQSGALRKRGWGWGGGGSLLKKKKKEKTQGVFCKRMKILTL